LGDPVGNFEKRQQLFVYFRGLESSGGTDSATIKWTDGKREDNVTAIQIGANPDSGFCDPTAC
jgi:hypothetical protein